MAKTTILNNYKQPNMYEHFLYLMSLASNTPFDLIKSPRRDAFICRPRQIVWHYLHKSQGMPLLTIAITAGKDRSSIRNGVKTISQLLLTDDPDTCLWYSRFLRLLAEEARTKSYQPDSFTH